MEAKKIGFIWFMFLLSSCVNISKNQNLSFQIEGRESLYNISGWELEGRIVVLDKKNSISASIHWKHFRAEDQVELAGPLGQGRIVILISDKKITVRSGKKTQYYYGEIDSVLEKELGMSVPLLALKFWVLGVVKPGVDFERREQGFNQLGWNVKYQQMVGGMPRKMQIKKSYSKIKLIINNWVLE